MLGLPKGFCDGTFVPAHGIRKQPLERRTGAPQFKAPIGLKLRLSDQEEEEEEKKEKEKC